MKYKVIWYISPIIVIIMLRAPLPPDSVQTQENLAESLERLKDRMLQNQLIDITNGQVQAKSDIAGQITAVAKQITEQYSLPEPEKVPDQPDLQALNRLYLGLALSALTKTLPAIYNQTSIKWQINKTQYNEVKLYLKLRVASNPNADSEQSYLDLYLKKEEKVWQPYARNWLREGLTKTRYSFATGFYNEYLRGPELQAYLRNLYEQAKPKQTSLEANSFLGTLD